MQFRNDHDFARGLDAATGVGFRDRFIIPQSTSGDDQIYFLGNSLGLQPKTTTTYVQEVLSTWSSIGVEGFFKSDEPWLAMHDQLAPSMAAIVGALPSEVVLMNALTVNLHLMMVSFYRPYAKRIKILCEAKAFSSDQYMLETHVRQRGLNPEDVIIEISPREGEQTITEEDIYAAINEHKDALALVFWGGVNYYTGQVFDMQAIAARAQSVGAKVGFDLAHAAGNVPLQLHDWGVDFACWCNYKYLNGGPGAVAGAYVHQRYHQNPAIPRFAGWWGYERDTRFQMRPGFVPAPSAEGWALSTPSPLLFAALRASLRVFDEAGFASLAERGKELSGYLLYLLRDIAARLPQAMWQVLTPENAGARGAQVSLLMTSNGKVIFDRLAQNGVFADWREPGVIRVAPAPLYNTFEEVWLFAQKLEEACKQTNA
jgi:kynureninase